MPYLSEVLPEGAELARDARIDATNFAGRGAGHVLCVAATAAWIDAACGNPATAALIVPPDLVARVPEDLGAAACDDPVLAFYRIHNRLAELGARVPVEPGIDPTARIDPTALVDPDCRIGPGVTVEAGAILRPGSVIGEGAFIGCGAIVGAEGQLSVRRAGFKLHAHHVGGVRIGAGAEIHAGAIVQREAFAGFTEIGPRTIVAPGCNVSHGVALGADCTLAPGAQVSGFSTIGDRVYVGPGAVVSNLLTVGDDARIEIGAVLVRSIGAGARYSGWFARPHARMRAMSGTLDALSRDPR